MVKRTVVIMMKIHRYIQVLAVFAMVLHGTGMVRGLHHLTHHVSEVGIGEHTHSDLSTDSGEELGGHSDPGHRSPSEPEDEDCELCLAFGSMAFTAPIAAQTALFRAYEEQPACDRTAVYVLSLSFDHPARAPPSMS